jgi:hypothetical protein
MVLPALMILMQSAVSAPPSSVPLTVCDVLVGDPTRLRGRIIKVRGYLSITDHGSWLSADCKKHLVTRGLTWGDHLSLYVDPSDENVMQSWLQVGERARRLHAAWRQDRIWLTIVGRVDTRPTMTDEVVQMQFGLARAGFGQGGESAAEIDVKSAEDISIEHRPSKAVPAH